MREKSGPEKQLAEEADARRVVTFRPRRRSASCWKGCAARKALPNSVAARASPRRWHYGWSKEFLEAGKRRLAGDTAPVPPSRYQSYGLRYELGRPTEWARTSASAFRAARFGADCFPSSWRSSWPSSSRKPD